MLIELHEELIAYLSEKLPGVQVAALTPDLRIWRSMALPSCLVELASISPFEEPGNRRDRSRVYLNFEARLIVDPNRANGWVELKDFSAVIWSVLRKWGPQTVCSGPVNLKRAGEDAFLMSLTSRPGLEGYLVWLIEWEQEAYLDFSEEEILPLLHRLTLIDNLGDTEEVPDV